MVSAEKYRGIKIKTNLCLYIYKSSSNINRLYIGTLGPEADVSDMNKQTIIFRRIFNINMLYLLIYVPNSCSWHYRRDEITSKWNIRTTDPNCQREFVHNKNYIVLERYKFTISLSKLLTRKKISHKIPDIAEPIDWRYGIIIQLVPSMKQAHIRVFYVTVLFAHALYRSGDPTNLCRRSLQ